MAQMRRAIQSWYAIQTEDYLGNHQLDEEQHNPGVIMAGGTFPNAHLYNVSGSRLRDGLSSQFYHVLIVANPDQLVRQEMGALGDYIAMLALTQPGTVDACPALPSILGLLVQGCANTAASITDADLAFLRALYRMTPDTMPGVQRNALISGMDEAIRPSAR